jgi:predicted SnoaL-like aldol condensation-catalyzing enzyme
VPTKLVLLAAALAAMIAGRALAQLPVEVHPDQVQLLQSKDPALAANKKLVFDFWRVVFQARDVERAPAFMAESYLQHNPNVPTGRAAFMEFFGRFPKQAVKPTIDDLVSIVAEGDLVVLGFRRVLPDLQNEGQTYTTTWFDMFRIEDGKIAEHWDYGTKE